MPDLFAGVATITGAVVLLLTTWIEAPAAPQGRAGGGATSTRASSTPPRSTSTRSALLNVVEEMAWPRACRCRRSSCWNKEEGINALPPRATTPDDAVIGVTRGMLTRLNREGAAGRRRAQFSHILNGDMRLNLRLMAMIHEAALPLRHRVLAPPARQPQLQAGGSRSGRDNNGLSACCGGRRALPDRPARRLLPGG
ncbi:MAG: hypothetical protein U1G05_15960 [Kiritimatiellia bacterium]